MYAISNFVENIGFSSDWRTNDREIIKDISLIILLLFLKLCIFDIPYLEI